MALHLVRFEHQDRTRWGLVQDDHITPLDIPCGTTGELLSLGYAGVRQAPTADETLDMDSVTLISPITESAKVLCQGANYREHMIDSGMNPDAKAFNLFFTKSSASITGPTGHIIKPGHVKLLDYEVELVLVLGKHTNGPVTVTADNLHDYVAGICIGNDVSARDVQLPQMQFHKGKSYRTFCPLGPILCLLDKDEMHYLEQMQLTLSVNGQVRQNDNTAAQVFKAPETLTEYAQIADFAPGDVLMTGTPSGCALGVPPAPVVKLSALLPEAKKWAMFVKMQQRRPEYLKAGDRMETTIVSSDGRIDLGKQQHVIKGGTPQ
ncbi:fumarylacetoacetate hydrolase family protein [Alloalcanivorax gelatiniphagus]|uniref:DUF2437 domain-containing protein n=1 Tax=Alloalcanivorax gelatiniphagus TaxID=1194167 RepID=A0ABY2XK60_9GAMM|nr:fumarylacetoacetate hydrolase family protein [Alloalcanivorax gelatiniphagus]TMW12377.1 DUF2437 domain-containing protein [Alloalcanivorax gelatiniphagus]